MEKLTLSNPITINGKKVKTLTYDTGAITVGMFAEASAEAARHHPQGRRQRRAPPSSTTPCTSTSL